MDLAKFRLGEALAIKKKLYPAGHLEVAATEDNLGLVHRYIPNIAFAQNISYFTRRPSR